MAIVFREGHLLLSVRYMVIIFQSIKRLYLAQLAARTKVKESDSLSSLWPGCILMKQMQRGYVGPPHRLQERQRRDGVSSESFRDINAKHTHAALHQSLLPSSKLATFCRPALFFFRRMFSEKGRCVLVCRYKSQNKECSVFSRDKAPHQSLPQTRKTHCVLGQAENSSKQNKCICS